MSAIPSHDWRVVERDGLRDVLGEGTLWSAREKALYWVDILAPALNRMLLADGHVQRWTMPEPIGWVAERVGGGLIAGLQSGFVELDLNPVRIRAIADPEPHLPGNRMNDGKADGDGAIWAGTMDLAEEHASGSLYCLAPDRTWSRADSGYMVPNGPAFSPDGRWLYHSDTARRQVYRFARAPGGGLGPRASFIAFEAEWGYPDGMTADAEGCLWIAHWGGGRVSRFDPDGRRILSVHVPARQVTNVTFAGVDLNRMFVTSASKDLGSDPMQGALFELNPGIHGVQPGLYGG